MSGQNRGGAYRPHNNKGSSTPGIQKAGSCRKTPNKTRLAKDPRFYKIDPVNYQRACEEVNKLQ